MADFNEGYVPQPADGEQAAQAPPENAPFPVEEQAVEDTPVESVSAPAPVPVVEEEPPIPIVPDLSWSEQVSSAEQGITSALAAGEMSASGISAADAQVLAAESALTAAQQRSHEARAARGSSLSDLHAAADAMIAVCQRIKTENPLT